jgi:RecJ-like exonuclease
MMPCGCVICEECNGTGTVWVSFTGKYLGKNRCDDFDEIEPCESCGGSGVLEYCDECYAIT